MRAIDADAFKDYIRGACEDMKHLLKDNANFAKLITESFCKDIDEQPPVEAIPIDWIRQQADQYPGMESAMWNKLLRLWEKEKTKREIDGGDR